MEDTNLLKLTPSKQNDDVFMPSVSTNNSAGGSRSTINSNNSNVKNEEEDHFLDFLVRSQGKRMNDQRCSFDPLDNKENCKPKSSRCIRGASSNNTQHPASYSDVPINSNNQAFNENSTVTNNDPQQNPNSSVDGASLMSNQHSVNSQASSSVLPTSESSNLEVNVNNNRDDLFDLIEKMQSRRFEEQRAPLLKRSYTTNESDYFSGSNGSLMTRRHSSDPYSNHGSSSNSTRSIQRLSRQLSSSQRLSSAASLISEEDFIEQLIRYQSSRLDDQRSVLPSSGNSNNRPTSMSSSTTRRSLGSNDGSSSHNPSHQSQNHPLRRSFSSQVSNVNSKGSALPDEDFLGLIARFQSAQIEDQPTCTSIQ